jgi:outer membrane protein assembly factor BamB
LNGSSRSVAWSALIAVAALGVAASSNTPAAASQKVCQQTRYLVLIDARTGAIDCTSPAPSGQVTASVADGADGWFIAGTFRHVGRVARPLLAHLDRNGAVKAGFRAGLPVPGGSPINKLVLRRSVLYAEWPSGVVALDARTGKQIWRSRVGRTDGSVSGCCAGVNDIAYANGVLYVVGVYKLIGGVARHGVAALDARSGRPLNWTVDVGPPGRDWIVDRRPSEEVLAVAVANGTVYLGGGFEQLGGSSRQNLAAVSARTGRATAWTPTVQGGGSIDAMVAAGNEVIVGGHARLAAFDVGTARPYPWTAKVQGEAALFAVSGDTVYLGGDPLNFFRAVGNRPANNLAAVQLPGGRFTSWTPSINTEVDVQTLAVSGNTVLVGGGFCATPGGC